MSNEENPFADPNDVNPFASQPAYTAPQQQQTKVDEYNPFANAQPNTQTPSPVQKPVQQQIFVPTQTAAPATIEPIRSEPMYAKQPQSSYGSSANSYGASATSYGGPDDAMRKRQEELERKAADLEKRENELKRMQGTVEKPNNFPPLPACCKINPCFYHDISVDIPLEAQRTCKMMFYTWQLYIFTLFFNFLCGLAGLCVGLDGGAMLFGVALLYLVLFAPCSFVCWYRPIYKALKSNSSFNYMLFFFIFFFQIIFTILYAFGITSLGTCGWINGASLIDLKSGAVAAMFFINAALFTLLAVCMILLLRKIHAAYRSSGASFEKAQKEFVSDVASNKNVQTAAADALKAGVTSGVSNNQQGTKY